MNTGMDVSFQYPMNTGTDMGVIFENGYVILNETSRLKN